MIFVNNLFRRWMSLVLTLVMVFSLSTTVLSAESNEVCTCSQVCTEEHADPDCVVCASNPSGCIGIENKEAEETTDEAGSADPTKSEPVEPAKGTEFVEPAGSARSALGEPRLASDVTENSPWTWDVYYVNEEDKHHIEKTAISVLNTR